MIRLLRRHALGPPPDHGRAPTWSEFLGQYKDFIWATDFLTVTTARLQTFYVLFFMELRRRHLMLFNVTEHPQAERAVHQLRNLSLQHDHLSKFIFHDRDGKFIEKFDAFAQASRTQIIKLPARSPNLNACAERRMRTARQEAPYQTGAPRINSGPLRALLVLEKVFELPAMRFADLASVPGGLTKLPTKPRQLVERTP